ncbi:hypothetical protein ANANG_G00021700, partial [Anguilla anguilla]
REAAAQAPHHPVRGREAPGLGWQQGASAGPKSSVQVTVGTGPLTSTLGSVTIQAQQYLEGMWSISRVNNFLPQPCLTQGLTPEPEWGGVAPEAPSATVSSCLPPAPQGSPAQPAQGAVGPPGSAQGASAAASFFIRAAQKLNLSSKRKKHQPPLPLSQEPSIYPTSFSGILQVSPPPAPPCLLRAVSKVKDNPGMGKVKVMMRICPSQGAHDTAPPPRAVAAPKMFAFDAVFTQDASQAEVCSGTVAEVIQSVVNGADGCIFCFGHVKLGKTYTMIGKDSSTQSLGIVPCAISWLFKLINERKEKTGTRFSIRVSAVEICGKDETLKDLLSEVASGSLQDGQSPGVYLREDPICGTQLQNQSELRAPTAEKAALFLDAAIAARSTSRPDCDEEERRNSHMLFTLHIYQYRMEKSGKGGMSGGRSRLHLIDLGSCEKVLSKSRDGGGGLCLSLTALGNVILALANGAKHVPYRDSKLTMLLRESLGNINCRTTMIAHISDSPANYAESLTTIQLASRIHRMRKKKSKYASSSSGGDSSCEEGRIRRPPHLRPFHPRTVALDPDLPAFVSDPDYSSSSEQSCDTVIYVGPGGAAISDRELSDNEGPPAFVPIIPSLNRKRVKGSPVDRDLFKCNTFAELQERLECIDGSEEPNSFTGEGRGSQTGPKMDTGVVAKVKEGASVPLKTPAKASSQENISPKQSPHYIPTHSNNSSPVKSKMEHSKWPGATSERGISENLSRTSADGEKVLVSDGRTSSYKHGGAASQDSEPVVREKVYLNKKPLPKPAPPPPQQREPKRLCPETEGSSATRIPPVGMSHQAVKRGEAGTSPVLGRAHHMSRTPLEVSHLRSTLRGRCFDRDILRTTVTLQQPVELNGEDELVFTVVEELSIGGIIDNGRPSSIISFNSDCSLQALASGSRPVSIISSINDEFDAYTSQVGASGVNIEVVTPLPDEPFHCIGSRRSSISSWLSEVSVCTLESEGAHSAGSFIPPSKHIGPEGTFYLDSLSMFDKEPFSPKDAKSSLNDSGFCFSEVDSESATSSKLSLSMTKCPPSPDSTKASTRGSKRVVDGCEKSSVKKAEPPSKMPQFRRGATTLGTVPVIHSSPESKGNLDATSATGSLKFSSLGKKTNGQKGKTGQIKGSVNPKGMGVNGSKVRSLSSSNSKALSSSTKSLAAPTTRSANLPPTGKTATRSVTGVSGKPGRGTIMGTKQAIRAANSRVSELASGSPGKHFRGSGDSDSGNDSGVNLSDDKTSIPMLPSPYSKITAPRRPQRYSSGHGSDNSSVLSGELPPAMGRTALFYHSGGSSGYESMIRDSEATGSASSAHDSMSESGMSSSGRTRASKSPKKRSNGLQRRRLIPAPLPDTASLGKKASATGQWVDLPPLPGTLKEPFEIKVYEIDDVERLQRRRQEDAAEQPFQDVEKGLLYFNTKLKILERRQQQIQDLRAKHDMLKEELEDTKQRLMMDPSKWTGEFEVDQDLDKESQEYLEALEQVTDELEYCVNLCKSRVMMVTCFDIGVASDVQDGPREVEV